MMNPNSCWEKDNLSYAPLLPHPPHLLYKKNSKNNHSWLSLLFSQARNVILKVYSSSKKGKLEPANFQGQLTP